MVWELMSANEVGLLDFIDGTFNKGKHLAFLNDSLFQTMVLAFDCGEDVTFKQDGIEYLKLKKSFR